MDHKERMAAGLPYKPWKDGLEELRRENKKRIFRFNHLSPDQTEKIAATLRDILGTAGDGAWVEAPFHCDYGKNIHVGKNFFANYNLTVLDVGQVKIGDNVLMGPNVSIYAVGHPIHPDARRSGYEYGQGVDIGSDVWLGGSVVILGGVTIGAGTVVAAGSVVTRDLPPNVVAAGNPCRVVRPITEADRDVYRRGCPFDVDDYLVPADPGSGDQALP